MLMIRTLLVLCAVTVLLALPTGAAARQTSTLNGTATLYQLPHRADGRDVDRRAARV